MVPHRGRDCNYPVWHQHVLEVSTLTARLFPDSDGKPLISGSTVGEVSIKLPLDEAAETAALQTLIDPRVPDGVTMCSERRIH